MWWFIFTFNLTQSKSTYEENTNEVLVYGMCSGIVLFNWCQKPWTIIGKTIPCSGGFKLYKSGKISWTNKKECMHSFLYALDYVCNATITLKFLFWLSHNNRP